MFNRYWRTYPWALQLALAFLMIFTLMSFTQLLLLILVPKLSGISIRDIVGITTKSPVRTIRIGVLVQAISNAGTFIIPSLLFAVFTHPRVREYLGLRAPRRAIHWLLVAGIMIGLVPVLIQGQFWMMKYVDLGAQANKIQQSQQGPMQGYMSLTGVGDLFFLLFALALLPAIGEELAFRGISLRLFHKGFNKRIAVLTPKRQHDIHSSMVIPVVASSLVFTYVHSSPYGFAFIFIGGCVLALIYKLTGSLLCSMLGHFLYNGLQILMEFAAHYNQGVKRIVSADFLPFYIPLIGLLIFAGSFYALVRTQTPLPEDWSADFRPGEEEGNEEMKGMKK